MRSVSEINRASLRRWTGLAKAPAIADFINEELANGLDKIVIFAIHQQVIEMLLSSIPGSVALYGKTTKDYERYINGFQGKIKGFEPNVMIAQLTVASTAITLTASCNVAFAEYNYVPKDLEQAWGRCHRSGQTRPVLARLFSLKSSVDEDISRVIMRKARDLNSFNAAVAEK